MRTERIARVVSRAWRSAVIGLVLGALLGFGVTFVVPRSYEAHADVLLTPAPGARAADAVDDRLLESYAHVLGGRTVAAAVREQTGSSQTVGAIADDVDGTVVEGTSLLRATARHPQSETAAALSDGAAEALVALLVDRGVAVDPAAAPEAEGSDDEQDAAPASTGRQVLASVVEQAAAPSRPTSPAVPWWILWGALLGLALGLVASSLRQLTDRFVRTPEDLTESTGAPLLGAVGYDRNAARTPLVSDLDPGDPRFEATRVLRTNLQFLDVDSNETVLTITSCLPDEGKSTTAANLAIALAHTGESVVLVDADLRRPRLAELFGVSGTTGLTTALVGAVDIADAVQQTSVPGLDVLTTGALPPNPSELLQTGAMADLVLTLKRRYDVVLFDAPPLLPVTDAALLASLSDGAVLLVRHGRTTREQVRTATARVSAVGADLLGTVLTMVPARGLSRYGYGYGYADAPRRRAPVEEGRRAKR